MLQSLLIKVLLFQIPLCSYNVYFLLCGLTSEPQIIRSLLVNLLLWWEQRDVTQNNGEE